VLGVDSGRGGRIDNRDGSVDGLAGVVARDHTCQDAWSRQQAGNPATQGKLNQLPNAMLPA
jgi:hypothetical protein